MKRIAMMLDKRFASETGVVGASLFTGSDMSSEANDEARINFRHVHCHFVLCTLHKGGGSK
jgi:hypothetical protein